MASRISIGRDTGRNFTGKNHWFRVRFALFTMTPELAQKIEKLIILHSLSTFSFRLFNR